MTNQELELFNKEVEELRNMTVGEKVDGGLKSVVFKNIYYHSDNVDDWGFPEIISADCVCPYCLKEFNSSKSTNGMDSPFCKRELIFW